MKDKIALIINAHPDDSEMAMGGTLILLKNQGYQIINVSLTKGGAGTYGDSKIREQEFNDSQRQLSSVPILLDYPDTSLENTLEARLEVVKLIRKFKPQIVFAPYLRNDKATFDGMMHRDHSVAGIITSEAVKLARFKGVCPELTPHKINNLFFYMIPLGSEPTLLVDISRVLDEAKNLIASYKSQLENNEVLENLVAMRRYYGTVIRVNYAEAFISEMPLLVNEGNFNSSFS